MSDKKLLIPSAIQFGNDIPEEYPCLLCLVKPACERNFLTCEILQKYMTLFLCAKHLVDSINEIETKDPTLYKLAKGVIMSYDFDVDLNSEPLGIEIDYARFMINTVAKKDKTYEP